MTRLYAVLFVIALGAKSGPYLFCAAQRGATRVYTFARDAVEAVAGCEAAGLAAGADALARGDDEWLEKAGEAGRSTRRRPRVERGR